MFLLVFIKQLYVRDTQLHGGSWIDPQSVGSWSYFIPQTGVTKDVVCLFNQWGKVRIYLFLNKKKKEMNNNNKRKKLPWL